MQADPRLLLPGRLVAVPVAAAVVAEALAWALAAAPGTLSPAWYAVPRLLAAVHLLTLGALSLSIVGFGWQLVPVVTAEAPPPWFVGLARWVNRLAVPGGGLLCLGMLALPPHPVAAVGAALLVGALLLRSGAVALLLLRARGRPAVRGWLVAAELCLVVGLGLGASLLAGRLGHPLLPDPIGGIGWHAALLLLGWVGGWIGGLGSVLLPMFAVAPTPRSGALAAAGVLWFGGLATGQALVWGLGAVVLVATLLWSVHQRVQRRLSVGIATAVCGLVGLLALVGVSGRSPGPTLAAVALVLFVLPVLRGVTLRIGPFLLWSHQLAQDLRRAPPVASLTPPPLVLAAGALAVLGGALVVGGLVSHHFAVGRLGAALAFLGTLAHGAVLITAAVRATLARNRLDALGGTESP